MDGKHVLCTGLLCMATSTQAALYDRGGGLIYDAVLDITWLQDTRYAMTSGYSADGAMDWLTANAWATGLSYYDAVRGVTWDDWRLPTLLPVNGNNFVSSRSYDGSTDGGYNISAPGSVYPETTASEMAYMFYVNLGNVSYYSTTGAIRPPGWSSVPNASFTDSTTGETIAFLNLRAYSYWFDQRMIPINGYAWRFDFFTGGQGAKFTSDGAFAWAVRDGDVGASVVPIPAAVWLFGSALVGLFGWTRRKA